MAIRIDDPGTSPSAAAAELDSPLLELEPSAVWHFFDSIRRIPRPSKREDAIAGAVAEWAERQDFACSADAAGNLIIRVPAAKGMENAPTIVLQAHLDMVGEKNSDVVHDFDSDPIDVWRDGDWIKAKGTTLGADNGMGMALAMAAAMDPDISRGQLELLFTRDEETGLNGAQALDGSKVSGRLMINLDAEEDDTIYIGCAGAAGVASQLPLARVRAHGGWHFALALRGLKGGHSGVDINTGRGNAVKLLGRVLVAALGRGLDFRLVHFAGGDKPNAIAREAFAELYLDADELSVWQEHLDGMLRMLRLQLGAVDPGLQLELLESEAPSPRLPLDQSSTARFLRLVDALPHGPVAMSQELPGLVETSANLARVETESEIGTFFLALRSSSDPALDGLGQSIASLCSVAGARAECLGGYSGWTPEPASELVKRTAVVYEELFGAPPILAAVHAGVECGVVSKRVPGLKAVSFGPDIRGAHSPDERVSISSVDKIYRWLKSMLETLAADAAKSAADV